ncbi:MAG: SpoIIE family protein phosphatase [Flavobacteriales bacterium]|nr:SpoIIE family protein phosphatase [Flavobacteriales bacterium]
MANSSVAGGNARTRYTVYGALFGFAFPVVATMFDAYMRDLGLGFGGLLEAQRTQPLHWIIDTAPIFLGLFARVAGDKQQEVSELNEGLEELVRKRTNELSEQNNELRVTQSELSDSLDRISQSINYAQRIQDAIIANTEELRHDFVDSFVIFRPRDIVSGDFPWYLKKDRYHYFAAVDCTGHGVPGAFMSLVGHFLLHRIVKEKGFTDTDQILNELHKEIVVALNQESDLEVHDGMDMAICRVDIEKQEIQFSGAGNPLYHLSDGEFAEHKGDFWSIGGTQYRKREPYTSETFNYKKGDLIAMFSDGITDQYSDDGTKKFGFKRIQKHLTQHHDQGMEHIAHTFQKEMDAWMGTHRQMDDMLFMGIRL